MKSWKASTEAGALCPVLGTASWERSRYTGQSPEEIMKNTVLEAKKRQHTKMLEELKFSLEKGR